MSAYGEDALIYFGDDLKLDASPEGGAHIVDTSRDRVNVVVLDPDDVEVLADELTRVVNRRDAE
jgi:hypothetical protein